MKELTERQNAAFQMMKNRLTDLRNYPNAEAYAEAWLKKSPPNGKNAVKYERMCAVIRWEMAQKNEISFTNMFHHSKTVREIAAKGYIRILAEERQKFNLHIFTLEILQEEGGSKDE